MKEEKRKYPRLTEECFVEMYSMGSSAGGQTTSVTNSRDVSLGGISFHNLDEVAPGDEYAILLSKLDIARDLRLDCIVKRCEPVDGGYLVAVEFTGITEEKVSRLQDFLEMKN